jgi:hypothetical protein
VMAKTRPRRLRYQLVMPLWVHTMRCKNAKRLCRLDGRRTWPANGLS